MYYAGNEFDACPVIFGQQKLVKDQGKESGAEFHAHRIQQAITQVQETLNRVFRDHSVSVSARLEPNLDPCLVVDDWLYIHSLAIPIPTLGGGASQPGWLLTSARKSSSTQEDPSAIEIVEHAESQRVEYIIDAAAVLITKYRLKLIHEEEWCKATGQEPPLGRFEDHQVHLYGKAK